MKKKKKNLLTKKQKKILIIIGIILFILIIVFAMAVNKKKKDEKVTLMQNLNRELTSIQEVVEYLESTYISEEKSSVDGYEIDIFLNFKCNLYENEKSNELYFKNFYEKIAMVTEFKSFRLIDVSKNITIAVKCNNSKISEVLINGETDYFKKEDSRRSRENELKVETLDLEVNSDVLQNLINANWNVNNVNLGTVESTFDKYQIYFDEGYEVRNYKGKIYNIVFTEKYNQKIVENYGVGDNLEKIEADLGTSYKDSSMIGYKTKDFYIFFSNNEISIYPNYKYDYEEFEKLVEKYNENKDINEFMYELTDIWPDYDQYTYDTNYFDIWYTLKGVRISYDKSNPIGIEIYENYKGDLKIEKQDYYNVYYKSNKNLMTEREILRKMQTEYYDNSGITQDPIHYSEKFYFTATMDGNYYRNIRILSLDEENPNNELEDTILIYKYIWADDTHLIYSIQGKGLYVYNAITRQIETLTEGTDNYEITGYDRNSQVIEYDGQKVHVEY